MPAQLTGKPVSTITRARIFPRGSGLTFSGARVTKPAVLNPNFRYLAIRGAAPIGGPQGNIHVTPAVYRKLTTQSMFVSPVVPRKQYATGHAVARTVNVGGVAIQTKPHGVPAFRRPNLKPYGGPAPTPLMLGSKKQIGMDTIRRPVFQPPQTLIPAVMQKLFKRG